MLRLLTYNLYSKKRWEWFSVFFSFYRFAFLLALFLFIGACSTTPSTENSELSSYLSQQQAAREYERRCPPVTASHINQTIAAVASRIASTSSGKLKEVQVVVLNCHQPFSVALSPKLIVISVGMLERLPTEAALAFVLAHEFSHILLDHFSSGKNTSYQQEQELAADKEALLLVVASHYNPWASLETFSQPQLFHHSETPSETHPLIEERINTLQHLLSKADWQPPGTVSSRTFKRMKYYLRK